MLGARFLRRTFRLAALALGALALLAVASTIVGYPAVAAAACPACYGLERAGESLFVERSMATQDRTHAADVISEARARVRAFYGDLARDPRILVCTTADCYRRIGGGGSRGMAILDRALILSPRGTDAVIAAHELSHIELHARLGLLRTVRRAVPQWFDEGVAVVVSDDPRYLAESGHGDRCLAAPDGELPTARAAWIQTASNDDVYAKAACRVNRWIAAHGGPDAVTQLLDAVAHGAAFDVAYR